MDYVLRSIKAKHARTHLVLIHLIFIGTFGSMSSAFAELRDVNIEFDRARATVIPMRVEDKRNV